MSSTLDIWCDNCGRWRSSDPETAKWGNSVPEGWVAVVFWNSRLHLCPECWKEGRKAISQIPESKSVCEGVPGVDARFRGRRPEFQEQALDETPASLSVRTDLEARTESKEQTAKDIDVDEKSYDTEDGYTLCASC